MQFVHRNKTLLLLANFLASSILIINCQLPAAANRSNFRIRIDDFLGDSDSGGGGGDERSKSSEIIGAENNERTEEVNLIDKALGETSRLADSKPSPDYKVHASLVGEQLDSQARLGK